MLKELSSVVFGRICKPARRPDVECTGIATLGQRVSRGLTFPRPPRSLFRLDRPARALRAGLLALAACAAWLLGPLPAEASQQPILTSAIFHGKALTLGYSRKLDTGSVPAPEQFSVSVNGIAQTPTQVVIRLDRTSVVTLALGTAAASTDTVTVSYTVPASNPIRRWTGFASNAAGLTDQPVTYFATAAPDKPALTAVAGNRSVRVTVEAFGTSHILRQDWNLRPDNSFSPTLSHSWPLTQAHMIGGHWTRMVNTFDRLTNGKTYYVRAAVANDYNQDGALDYTYSDVVSVTPTVSVMGMSVGGSSQRSLSLSLNRELVADSRPPASAFEVTATPAAGAAGSGATARAAGGRVVPVTGAPAIDGDTLSLALASPVAEGEQVTVRYRRPGTGDPLRDADGGLETPDFEGEAEVSAEPEPAPALTAAFHGLPDAHDGKGLFRFELRFSEDFPGRLDYRTLRDAALRVENGRVREVRRAEPGQNRRWMVAVRPASDEDVVVTLPAGAVTTEGGRSLAAAVSATVPGPADVPAGAAPLTASFHGLPGKHDGERAFSFGLTFSEEVKLSVRTLKEQALVVRNGRVTKAKRVVKGENRRWTVTVKPASFEDVAMVLAPSANCGAAGAVCTHGGKPLSNLSRARIAGPAPLTASFHDLPAEHDGERAFRFGLTFSEEVKLSFRTLKEQALVVRNGRVTKAKRVVKGENRRWTVTVKPASFEDVTVVLAASANCRAAGAVCTHGGKPLSNESRARIAGPAVLSVADAEAHEGEATAVEFAVTLSRAPSRPVTVDYATADGTATAGEDYTATSGTLTFAAGETSKTVSVPLLDDAIDEGRETFTLRLSNAQGAHIEDGEATGTIVNTDNMPKAWTARFGRTVAVHVVDAVEGRLQGATDSWLQLGGHRLGGGPDVHDTVQRLASERSLWDEPAADPVGQEVTFKDLLLGSAFHLVSNPEDEAAGPRLSVWGRVAASGFDGREDQVSLDGTVTTASLGVDGVWKRWLTGLLLAYSEGDGAFTHATMPGGDLTSSLTSVHPYVAYTLSDRVRLWGMVGYGSGALQLRLEDQRAMDTDLSMTMGALGVRGSLLNPSHPSGFELALRADVLWMVMDSAKADNLAATEADASRLRLVLEGSRPVALAGGGSFTPSLELGLRHDGGDAETGSGLEVGGSLRYASAWGLSIEASVRGLLAHEAQDYTEWGASGALRFDPGRQGRGLTASIVPTWGSAVSGVSRLWGQAGTAGLAANSPLVADAAGRLQAELGYGLATLQGRGLLTPYARVALTEGPDQAWHLGTRLALAQSVNLSLEASRRQRQGDTAAHELALRANVGW